MTTLSNKSGIRTRSQESVLFSLEHTSHAVRPGKLWQKVAKNTSSQQLVLYNAFPGRLRLCIIESYSVGQKPPFWLSAECWNPHTTRNKQKRKGEKRSSSYREIFLSQQKRIFFFNVYPSTSSCAYLLKKCKTLCHNHPLTSEKWIRKVAMQQVMFI